MTRLADRVRKVLQFVNRPGDLTDADRNKVMDHLSAALDEADVEQFDGTITFETTPNVYKQLRLLVVTGNDNSPEAQSLCDEMNRSRLTRRRAYVKLPADHNILRWLKTLIIKSRANSLHHGLRSAYSRLIEQIEQEVLSLSPLEFLAKAGL